MRNRFEERVAAALPPGFAYEALRIAYTLPTAHYTPDWVSADGLTVVEAKGLWRPEDRRKMRLIRQRYPDLRIVMVFQHPERTISKSSKTTYRQYAEKLGIEVRGLDGLSGL